MAVPNLKELAGKSLRCRTSPEWFEVNETEINTCSDPWYFEIPGSVGDIVPWGDDLLAIVVDNQPKRASELMRQDWVTQERSQHGDDGCNAVFHVSHFKKAVRFAKSRRKRAMSEEQRAANAERLRAYREQMRG